MGVGDEGGTRRYSSFVSLSITAGIGPAIWFLSRPLRRRGAVARRAGRRGRGGNSQPLQLGELADLGRDRAVDLIAAEVPATPRGGRAPRRASWDAGGTRRISSFVSLPIWGGIGPVIWLSWRYLRRRGSVAPRAGLGDAGGTRSSVSAVSRPISVGIGPVILFNLRFLRRRGAVARRAGRRGRGGNSQLRHQPGVLRRNCFDRRWPGVGELSLEVGCFFG